MKSLILSSYFSKKPHPNDPNDSDVIGRELNGHVACSNIKYIEGWYNSVVNTNTEVVMFHDELTDDFVSKYSADNIKFVNVTPNEYSNNDFRFFCFYNYLNSLTETPDCVFHTDASDVIIVSDPAPLVMENPKIDYFTCKDSLKLNDFPYMRVHESIGWDDTLMFMINQNEWDLINMGVIGGKFEKMLKFYKTFVKIREELQNPHFNADMWICQYLLRSQLQPCELMIGDPVCSEFKKYQNKRKDVYFIHK
jgi:hypothetical protein